MPDPRLGEARRVWVGLLQRGEVDAAILPLQFVHADKRAELEGFLKKPWPDAQAAWGDLQFLRGYVAAMADAWKLLKQVSVEPDRVPSGPLRRPDDELLSP